MYDDSDIFNLNDEGIQRNTEIKPTAWKEPYDYSGESWLKWLGRLTGTGVSHAPDILGVPGSLAEFAASKLSGQDVNIPYLPTMETFKKGRQALSEKFLPDKDYLDQQDIPSKIASYIGGDLPFLASTGGTGLLRSLVSGATMGGLEAAGAPAGLQLAGGLLSGGITDYAKKGGLVGSAMREGKNGRMFGFDTLTDFAERTKNAAYGDASKIGSKVRGNAGKLRDYLDNTLSSAGRRLTKVEYNSLKDEINTLRKDISKGGMYGHHALDARAKFNRLAKEAFNKGNKELGKQYDVIGDHIREVVGETGKISPEYGKAIALGDQTLKNLSDQGKLRSWLEKSTSLDKSNPLTKVILLGAGGISGGLLGASIGKPAAALGAAAGTAAGYGAGVIARELARVVDITSKNPVIKNHLKQIMKAVGKGQMQQLPFHIAKLDKEVSKHSGNGMPYTLEDVD